MKHANTTKSYSEKIGQMWLETSKGGGAIRRPLPAEYESMKDWRSELNESISIAS